MCVYVCVRPDYYTWSACVIQLYVCVFVVCVKYVGVACECVYIRVRYVCQTESTYLVSNYNKIACVVVYNQCQLKYVIDSYFCCHTTKMLFVL